MLRQESQENIQMKHILRHLLPSVEVSYHPGIAWTREDGRRSAILLFSEVEGTVESGTFMLLPKYRNTFV